MHFPFLVVQITKYITPPKIKAYKVQNDIMQNEIVPYTGNLGLPEHALNRFIAQAQCLKSF